MDKPASQSAQPSIAVVVPVLNEAEAIEASLSALSGHTGFREIIVVDGGSEDATCDVAGKMADAIGKGTIRVLKASRGRALQMNRGAQACQSEILLFVHADTRLPMSAAERIGQAMRSGHVWGRFDVRLDDHHPFFRLMERSMNWRSALSGIATGDQAIFVRREAFDALGGYAPIGLMEDIELCRRLKRVGRPALIHDKVTVSTRRWRRHGIARTVLLMWVLRLLYWFGVSDDRLVRRYRSTG
ncbi:MAG: glycosyltransferase [Nitrospira sp.]|jgi:rSAM/selenodomain-associated transferase 2|nr:glycosyltransferase [Nitrospira sp.]